MNSFKPIDAENGKENGEENVNSKRKFKTFVSRKSLELNK